MRRSRPRQEDAGRDLVGIEAGRLQEPLEGRRTVPNQTGRLPPHLGLLRNFARGVNRSPIRIGMIDHVLKHIAVRISSFWFWGDRWVTLTHVRLRVGLMQGVGVWPSTAAGTIIQW